MIKVIKDGITRFISERDLQEYKDWGFKVVEHKPEPMIIKEEPKEDVKEDKKAAK